MRTDFPARKERFLNAFFGRGNQLTREALRTSQTAIATNARRWEETLQTEQDIAIFPRKQRDQFFWYAIAFSERALRELREQIQAFVGPSYSDFREDRHRLDPHDAVEAAIVEFAGPYAFRFRTTPAQESREELARVLDRMWTVLQEQEPRQPEDDRSTGRVLRDFHMALAAGNRPEAETCLRQLRSGSRLDTLNLQFLEIQLRAELGLWEEILVFPGYVNLIQVRRPVAVSRTLLTAVYRVKLAGFEITNQPEEAIRVFQEEILPQSGTLYQSRLSLQDPDIVKSYLLATVVATPSQSNTCQELLDTPGLSPEDLDYMRRVIAVIAAPQGGSLDLEDPLLTAQQAVLRLDWDIAAAYATTAVASLERARVLLRCAYELPSNQIERTAVEAVAELSTTDRERLLQSRLERQLLTRLTGAEDTAVLAATVPGNWTE